MPTSEECLPGNGCNDLIKPVVLMVIKFVAHPARFEFKLAKVVQRVSGMLLS